MVAERAIISESRLFVGDIVRVAMPRGHNKRGVWGISPMYNTSTEAKFDGATGVVTEINPEGPYTIPLYLVDFRDQDNSRLALPWQAHWFREVFLEVAGRFSTSH